MATPSEFFNQCFDYLNTLPKLNKPNSNTHPDEYFLYQLLQCYISYKEKSHQATVKILDYLNSLMKFKTASRGVSFPTNIASSYHESESAVRSDEERQILKTVYQEHTLKRKLAYEHRVTNPDAYNEFNMKRVKKIQQRRQTEPASSSNLYYTPSYVQNHSPGFVVSSQEEEEVPATEPEQFADTPAPAEADPAPADYAPMSPYDPYARPYEPSVNDLFKDGYLPNVIDSPAHLPPALNGDLGFINEFTPPRSTEDLEENLTHVAANLESDRSRQRSRSSQKRRAVLTPSPSPVRSRDRSRSNLRQRSPSVCSSKSSKSSKSSRSSRSNSSNSSTSSRSQTPVRPPPPPPPRKVAQNRTKGIAFMIKDKGVYSCMSGYSSYLKSKIKRTQGKLLVEPMYINNDNVDLAVVWTDLARKLLSKFSFLSKVNKTLKAKSISDTQEGIIRSYIVKQLRKLKFE